MICNRRGIISFILGWLIIDILFWAYTKNIVPIILIIIFLVLDYKAYFKHYNKVKIEVRKHNGYTEWKNADTKGFKFKQYFGRFHYIYTHQNKKISLAKLRAFDDRWFWEIYCLKGKLFEDCERFGSKEKAEERIMELLIA